MERIFGRKIKMRDVQEVIFNYIKRQKFLVLYLSYMFICCLLFVCVHLFIVLIDTLFSEQYWISELLIRLSLGVPLLIQLLITYTVYIKWKSVNTIRIIFYFTLFHTIICGLIAMYELYFTSDRFIDELAMYVVAAQIIFQVVILLFMVIMGVKQVVIIKHLAVPTIILVLTLIVTQWTKLSYEFVHNGITLWIVGIVYAMNIFNPILLYFISNITKGRIIKQ